MTDGLKSRVGRPRGVARRLAAGAPPEARVGVRGARDRARSSRGACAALELQVTNRGREDRRRRRPPSRNGPRRRRFSSAPTWTRSRSRRAAAHPTVRRSPGGCTRAVTTGTWRCCSARRRCSRRARAARPRRRLLLPAGGGRVRRCRSDDPGGRLSTSTASRRLRAAPLVALSGRHRSSSGRGRRWPPRTSSRRRIVGRGGHGALPHEALDPIVAAATAIVALQIVVARSVDPMQPAVVTVGRCTRAARPNVIPDAATMQGTLRSFDAACARRCAAGCGRCSKGRRQRPGARSSTRFTPGYPAVVNDAAAVARVRAPRGRASWGRPTSSSPSRWPPRRTSRTSCERVPGAFAFIGAGNDAAGHHGPAPFAALRHRRSRAPHRRRAARSHRAGLEGDRHRVFLTAAAREADRIPKLWSASIGPVPSLSAAVKKTRSCPLRRRGGAAESGRARRAEREVDAGEDERAAERSCARSRSRPGRRSPGRWR